MNSHLGVQCQPRCVMCLIICRRFSFRLCMTDVCRLWSRWFILRHAASPSWTFRCGQVKSSSSC